jgi:hypothetical protein
MAVLVVHHARKGAGNARAGQGLRGSSEFHAWGDSNLYLRRDGDGDRLTLSVAHRAAPPLGPMAVALTQRGPALALELVERGVGRGLRFGSPIQFADLRQRCRVRAATSPLSSPPAASPRPATAIASPPADRLRRLTLN